MQDDRNMPTDDAKGKASPKRTDAQKPSSDASSNQRKVDSHPLSKRMRMINSSDFKKQVFYALENIQQARLLAKCIGIFLFLLIVANAILVFLSAQPNLEPFTTNILNVFFVFSTICFCIEYISRVWVADLAYGNCTRARARAKYIFSPLGIIDFLSFAPNMIAWVLPVTPILIHAVNVMRLIRLVKVTRYMRGFRTMARVLSKHYQEIVAAFLVILLVIIISSVVMYEVEHEAQPDKFSSLFQGIWFAVETVTSTGYGDIVPITVPGKICGMIIMMFSLGLIAIPGGIFSAGFVAEFQYANMRRIERDVERNIHHTDNKSESDRFDDHSRSDDHDDSGDDGGSGVLDSQEHGN